MEVVHGFPWWLGSNGFGAGWVRAWAAAAAGLAVGLQGCCNIELGYAMPQSLDRILAAHAHAHAYAYAPAHAVAVEEVCSIVR